MIQTIWEKNGIPVVSNLALNSDGEYCCVEPNGHASACGIACKANSLVFLTDIAGVTDAGGNVIRWLDASDIENYVRNSMISGSIMAKLRASLECGVGRVRIFPFLEVRQLPEFYFKKLEYGTDIYINTCHSRSTPADASDAEVRREVVEIRRPADKLIATGNPEDAAKGAALLKKASEIKQVQSNAERMTVER